LVFNTSKPIWESVGHTVPRADRPEWKKLLAELPAVEERARDAERDGRILRGCEVSAGNLQQAKREVRFLVSSTFTVSRPCAYGCALCVVLPSVRPHCGPLAARLRAGMSSVWVPPRSSADADLAADTLHRCAQDTNEERNLFLGDAMPALSLFGRKLKLEVPPPPLPPTPVTARRSLVPSR